MKIKIKVDSHHDEMCKLKVQREEENKSALVTTWNESPVRAVKLLKFIESLS